MGLEPDKYDDNVPHYYFSAPDSVILCIQIDKMGSKTIIRPVFIQQLPRLSYNFEQFNLAGFEKDLLIADC